jgi:hypothetical protein
MKESSKPKKRPPPPTNRPGPFHSKYLDHAQDILEWRRDGWTWKQVVEGLAKKHCKADEGGVCRFVKRFEEGKAYGIGQRPNHQEPASPKIHAKKDEPEASQKPGEKYRKAVLEDQPTPANLFDEKHIN